jgi:transcriptional regulator with XRE-family HTH domain
MMPKAKNQYPNRLWIARKKKGLKQKSVARCLGIKNEAQISLYETGRVSPKLDTVLTLSAIYGVTVNDLYKPLFEQIKRRVGPVEAAVPQSPLPASRAFYL